MPVSIYMLLLIRMLRVGNYVGAKEKHENRRFVSLFCSNDNSSSLHKHILMYLLSAQCNAYYSATFIIVIVSYIYYYCDCSHHRYIHHVL